MVKHVQEPPPRPSTLAPVPPELELLILACLEKDPRARPPSALEVARRLDALVAGRPGIGALAADTQRSRFAPSLHETDPSALAPGRPAERAASTPPPEDLGPRDSAQATAPRRPIWPLAVGLGAIATAIALIAILGGTKPAPGTSAAGATPASDAAAPIAATSDAAAPPSEVSDPTLTGARARLDALLAARGAPLAPEPCRLGSARAITLAVATLEAADALARTPTETTRIRLEDALGAQRQLADDPTAQAAEGLLALAKGVSALAEVGVGEGGEGTEAAAALADKVIARCPAWAQPHHLRGRLAQRAGLNPAARKAYLAAIERDASWGAPRFNLALLDLDDGAPAAAEAGLSEVLRADEHWPDAHLVRAETRLRMGDATGALSDALAAVAETPDRAEAWMVRGAAEQRAGVGDRGQAAYCRAKALGHAGAAALCPR
jgi:Tfp pilus assembly protein PilF